MMKFQNYITQIPGTRCLWTTLYLFSLSKEDFLEKSCEEWWPEMNLNKTKIMVFNKKGAAIRN